MGVFKDEPTGDPVSTIPPTPQYIDYHLFLSSSFLFFISISKTHPRHFRLQLARARMRLQVHMNPGPKLRLHGMLRVCGYCCKLPCKKRSFNILEAVRSLQLPCTSLHTAPLTFYTNPPHRLPQSPSNTFLDITSFSPTLHSVLSNCPFLQHHLSFTGQAAESSIAATPSLASCNSPPQLI